MTVTVVGMSAGMAGLVIRGHGGPIVPTVVLSAPAVLLCSFLLGDNVQYAVGVVVGTGLWYGLATLLISKSHQRATSILLLLVHLLCVVILLVSAARQ